MKTETATKTKDQKKNLIDKANTGIQEDEKLDESIIATDRAKAFFDSDEKTETDSEEEVKTEMTSEEKDRLVDLEITIEKGFKSFHDVGDALEEVKNSKLYRGEFETFDEYCRVKWNMGVGYAYKIISSNKTFRQLSKGCPGIDLADVNESIARTMIKLPTAKKMRTALEKARKVGEKENGGKMTAKIMQDVVSKMITPKEESEVDENADPTDGEIIVFIEEIKANFDLHIKQIEENFEHFNEDNKRRLIKIYAEANEEIQKKCK